MPRLLLVDDSPSIYKIAATLLGSTDVQITWARSTLEYLGLVLKEAPFDAAMVDTTLPETDGWELLEYIRNHPKAANLPIALMAGVLDDTDPNRLKKAPIQAFLLKPIDLLGLDEKVQTLISAPVSLGQSASKQADPIISDLPALKKPDLAEEKITPATAEITEPLIPDELAFKQDDPILSDLLVLKEPDLAKEETTPDTTEITEPLSPDSPDNLDEPAVSDLLILEEQDLLEDEIAPDTAEITEKTMSDAESETALVLEYFGDLEDIDLGDIGDLDQSIPIERGTAAEPAGMETDESNLNHSVSHSLGHSVENLLMNTGNVLTAAPVDYLETSPGDFGAALLAIGPIHTEAQEQNQSARREQEQGQMLESLFNALQLEFEQGPTATDIPETLPVDESLEDSPSQVNTEGIEDVIKNIDSLKAVEATKKPEAIDSIDPPGPDELELPGETPHPVSGHEHASQAFTASSTAQELLANSEFIDAITKAVAKRLDSQQ